MSNPLSKIIFIVMGVVIMFLIAPAYFKIKSDSVVQVNVEKETAELVERVTTQGYITRTMYEEYLQELAVTGKLYDVELTRELIAYEPEYRIRTAAEVVDEDEAGWTGTNPYDAPPVHTEIPEVIDPVNTGNVNTETNESVLAKAVDTGPLPGHVHTDECYAGHRHTFDTAYQYTHTHSHTSNCKSYLKNHYLYGNCYTCGRTYNYYTFSGWWNSIENKQEGQGFELSCPNCGSSSHSYGYELQSWGYSCGYDIDLNGDHLYDQVPTGQSYIYLKSYPQTSNSPYTQNYVNGCKTYHYCGQVDGYHRGEYTWYDDSIGGYRDTSWYDGPTAFYSFASNPYGFCIIPYGFQFTYASGSNVNSGNRFYLAYFTNIENGVLTFKTHMANFPELTPQQFFGLGDPRNLRNFIHTYMGISNSNFSWVDSHVRENIIGATSIETLEYYDRITNTYGCDYIKLCDLASEQWNLTCNWTPPADHDHTQYNCSFGYVCHKDALVLQIRKQYAKYIDNWTWTTEYVTEILCSECDKVVARLSNYWDGSRTTYYSLQLLLRNKSTGAEELITVASYTISSWGNTGDQRLLNLFNTSQKTYTWYNFYKSYPILSEPLPSSLSTTYELILNDILPPNPQDMTPDCDKVVKSITATHPNQTVYTNEPLITTVVVIYADGSTKTVVGNTSFSTANPVSNQTVTITYQYTIDGVTMTKECNITVTVIRRTKTCPNGHTYNFNSDGSDPGCPYCKNWLSNLTLYYPSGGVLNMGRDPEGSLEALGVSLFATYLDGHTEIVTHGYVDNLDPDYVGTQFVTIGYKGLTTTLQVNVLRNKKQCDICGLYYNLYLDNGDPGCPYCKANVPIFTGNVMKYKKAFYKEEIYHELYEGSGIYYFRRGDVFQVKTVSKNNMKIMNLFAKLFHLRISVTKRNTVKDEKVFSR